MRLVQLSDSHIFEEGGFTTSNFTHVVELVNRTLKPDLVIHTGDVVGLLPDHASDRRAAAALLSRIEAPTLVVPGNHDVGDADEGVTSARVAEHCRVFGPAPFLETANGWGFLGLNSQVMGSGLPEEEQQWDWLERTLRQKESESLIVFLHRPLWNPDATSDDDFDNSVPNAARERLLSLPGSERIRAVGNGHLHIYRRHRRPQLLEVWGPGTSFIGHRIEHPFQFGQCGLVEWRLDGDSIETFFRAPAELEEREFSEIPEVVNRLDKITQTREA